MPRLLPGRTPPKRVRLASYQRGDPEADGGEEALEKWERIPSRQEDDVRFESRENPADLPIPESEEGAEPRRPSTLRQHAPRIACQKRQVPLERPAEPRRLLCRARNHGEEHVKLYALGDERPEPRSVVLDRVCRDDGDPHAALRASLSFFRWSFLARSSPRTSPRSFTGIHQGRRA